MKRKALLVLFGVLLVLTACGKQTTKTPEIPSASLQETPTSLEQEVYTEEDILDIFQGYAYADPSNRRVIGCAVMEESQYGVFGVVQYTTDDQQGSQFDFIRQNAPPLCAGVYAESLENSLEYWKSDSVSCQILDEKGNVHICIITYYETEIEQGFRMETEQKEG